MTEDGDIIHDAKVMNSRALNRRMRSDIQPRILAALKASRENRQPVPTVRELARMLNVRSATAIAQAVERLRRDGLIEPLRSGEERKARNLQLTRQGETFLRKSVLPALQGEEAA